MHAVESAGARSTDRNGSDRGRRSQVERPSLNQFSRLADSRENEIEIELTVGRSKRAEPPLGLSELPFAADAVPAPRLVPRDGDMDEALEEILLLGRRSSPRILERFVRREELSSADEVDAAPEVVLDAHGVRL
jgi:hypothetical protein